MLWYMSESICTSDNEGICTGNKQCMTISICQASYYLGQYCDNRLRHDLGGPCRFFTRMET